MLHSIHSFALYRLVLTRFLLLPSTTGFFLSRVFMSHQSPRCCNHLCKKVLKIQTDVQWDHELGAWKGERSPSVSWEDYKSPLYVFGYGSLIWRPGEFLSNFPSFPATATQCKRLFAQKSLDHRGNSKFPGLVLNLVKDDYLIEKGYSLGSIDISISKDNTSSDDCYVSKENTSSEDCYGLVWLIPDDKIGAVISYLDDREKGGYSRHFIHVKLQQDTPHYPANSVIDAVVYTGLEDNPNFFLPKVSPSISNHGFMDLQYRSIVVDVITAAKGLSGTNVEYLLKLQRYLEERNMADSYINRLAAAVRMRLGTWRRQSIINHILSAIPSTVGHQFNPQAPPITLFGCGSNEFHQLHDAHSGLDTSMTDITDYIHRTFHDIPGFVHVEWIDTERHTVLAAGGNSAYLYEGRFAMWGTLAKRILQKLKQSFSNGPIVIGDENIEILPIGDDEEILVIDGIEGAALGYDSALLLLPCGWVVTLGEQLFQSPSSFVLPEEAFRLQPTVSAKNNNSTNVINPAPTRFVIELNLEQLPSLKPIFQIVKLAIGLKVAAAITYCGGLLVWGTPNSGTSHEVNIPWYPPTPAEDFFFKNSTDCSSTSNAHLSKCIDVACGAYHLVVIDDEGRVFTHTDIKYVKKLQKYGTLGDSLPLKREDSDYSSRGSFHQDYASRVSISEGAASSIPRSTSWTSFLTAAGVATPPNGASAAPLASSTTSFSSVFQHCSQQQQQLKMSTLLSGPSSLAMHQVLLPTDVRFLRAAVGWSHTVVRGLKRCGEVVCYAWGRKDMSQYQVISEEELAQCTMEEENETEDRTITNTSQHGNSQLTFPTIASLCIASTPNCATVVTTSLHESKPANHSHPLQTKNKNTPSGLSQALSSVTAVAASDNKKPNVSSHTIHNKGYVIQDTEVNRRWHRPRPLLPLPNQRTFAEVWCGSEYTVAMDAQTGSLWAMGWNEHGNLGLGNTEELSVQGDRNYHGHDSENSDHNALGGAYVTGWRLVAPSGAAAQTKCNLSSIQNNCESNDFVSGIHIQGMTPTYDHEVSQVQVAVFDGSVACGGAHLLCLQRPGPSSTQSKMNSSVKKRSHSSTQ